MKNEKLENLKQLLSFDNDEPYVIAEKLISKLDKDIIISRTGDSEILLYRENNGSFYNILIDSDADVSFMLIAKERSKTTSYITDTSVDSIDKLIKDFYTNR